MKSALLLTTAVAIANAGGSTIRFTNSGSNVDIQYFGAAKVLSIGDADTCVKVSGSAR
jgi:hypothetical protein